MKIGQILVAALACIAGLWVGRAEASFTADVNPAGTFTPFSGTPFGLVNWGMDFDVNQPIFVTDLGAYDVDQDGIFNHEVKVGIFNRDTQTLLGFAGSFTSADPGTLEGGSRFKSLPTALVLPAGFHGSIVAWGYTVFGAGGEPLVDEAHQPPSWTLDDGGGLLSFVGTSRYGTDVTPDIDYPTTPDIYFANPSYARNQNMTGTFKFTTVPEPTSTSFGTLAALALCLRRRRS